MGSRGERPTLLIIVAQHEPDLFESLKQEFVEAEAAGRVQVIVDRRRKERRQRIQPHKPERRQGERRRAEKIEDTVRSWWAVPGCQEP